MSSTSAVQISIQAVSPLLGVGAAAAAAGAAAASAAGAAVAVTAGLASSACAGIETVRPAVPTASAIAQTAMNRFVRVNMFAFP